MRILEIAPLYQRIHIMSTDNWKIFRYWQYMHPKKSFASTMRALPNTIKREITSLPKIKHRPSGSTLEVVCVDEISGFNYSVLGTKKPRKKKVIHSA